jgi:hypothetical protein
LSKIPKQEIKYIPIAEITLKEQLLIEEKKKKQNK